jgi:hypothetical protein
LQAKHEVAVDWQIRHRELQAEQKLPLRKKPGAQAWQLTAFELQETQVGLQARQEVPDR